MHSTACDLSINGYLWSSFREKLTSGIKQVIPHTSTRKSIPLTVRHLCMPPISITVSGIAKLIYRQPKATQGHWGWWSFAHSPLGALSLLILTNRKSLSSHQVPEDWKKALVTPIFKKGDSDSLGNCRHFPVSAVNYSFCLFYGLLSGLGSLLRMFCFLWLSQLGVINYITTEIFWAHNFDWVQWKADSVYFLREKKCLECLQLVK